MNKLSKVNPLFFILIGIGFGFVYVKLNSTTINGKVLANNNTCLSDKTAPCTLRIVDSRNEQFTIDYSYCSWLEKYAPRGYVPSSIYKAKPSDSIEVTGRTKGSTLKVCPGWLPPLQIRLVN